MRKRLGLPTQAAAARKSLVNSQQINAWEKGQIVPRLAVLANYMDQLGASLYDLADALEIANGRQPREELQARELLVVRETQYLPHVGSLCLDIDVASRELGGKWRRPIHFPSS